MLRALATWWLQQMASLLPPGLRGGGRWSRAVVVRAGADGLQASLRRGRTLTPLGRIAARGEGLRRLRAHRGLPLVLALPPGALLQQTASLPIAAELDLEAVLRNEMDRLTPFTADDVFWTWRLQARDAAAARLVLRLLLVPKAAVAASLEALRSAGLRPAAIEAAAGGGVEHLPLEHAGGRGQRSGKIALALCAVLLAALIAIPVIRQERAIDAAQDEAARLRPQVAEAEALRSRLVARASGTNLFAAELARVGSPLRALAALTDALPDDTYLLSLAMRERKITFTGRSATAAKLIGTLAAEPDLRDPAFDSPITRVSGGQDLFSIRVTLAP